MIDRIGSYRITRELGRGGVEGETLAERLDHGALPVDEALEIAIKIAAGVEAAHEAGVIHRDLKPANVKITSEGDVKVLDFGLARVDEGATSSSSSGTQSESPTLTTETGELQRRDGDEAV